MHRSADQASGERRWGGLGQIDAVVSDLDGVVWRGAETLPGVLDFFSEVRRRGLPLVFATNNSGKVPAQYVERLAAIGIAAIREDDVVTSGVATAAYLQEHYPPTAKVHVLGNPGLKSVIAAAGFTLAGPVASAAGSVVDLAAVQGPVPGQVDVVVASIDHELSYEKLAHAAAAILAGADFIGTNGDPTFPTVGGLLPGSGSVIAALEVATGRRATLMGKPEAPMFAHALRVLGTAPQRTLMIGDRLDTDILGAQRSSLRTALVLTGSTSAVDLPHAAVRPDLVCPGLPELRAALFDGRPAPQ